MGRYHSISDLFYGGDEVDCEDESRPEFMCPFCGEEFDVVGLCCHIDEGHAVYAKNGFGRDLEKKIILFEVTEKPFF